MRNSSIILLFALSACSDPKLEIGVYAGMHGNTVARMTTVEMRTSKVAPDRRVDARLVNPRAVVLDTLTPAMLRAELEAMAADEQVLAALTRLNWQAAVEATQAMNQQQLPYLSLTATTPQVVGGDTWGFSLVPSFQQQAEFIAQHVTPGQRIGIVYIDDVYGQGMRDALTAAFTSRGSVPVDVRRYEQSWDEPRMLAVGHELRAKRPQVLIFAGRSPSLALVMQPFREGQDSVRVIGTDLAESFQLYNDENGTFHDVQFVRYFNPRSSNPRIKNLWEAYLIWVGIGELTGEIILVHEGMTLIGDALRNGVRTRAELRDYLKSLGKTRPAFEGPGGPLTFENGFAVRRMELAAVTPIGVVPVTRDSAASRR